MPGTFHDISIDSFGSRDCALTFLPLPITNWYVGCTDYILLVAVPLALRFYFSKALTAEICCPTFCLCKIECLDALLSGFGLVHAEYVFGLVAYFS